MILIGYVVNEFILLYAILAENTFFNPGGPFLHRWVMISTGYKKGNKINYLSPCR